MYGNSEYGGNLEFTPTPSEVKPVILIDASNTTSYVGISITAATTYMGFCSYALADIGLGAGREVAYEGTYQL